LRRNFFTNISLLIFLNLLVKPFWIFGIDRTVQNVVGTQEYGLYFSLFNFSILLNILLDLGINNYNNRNIAQNGQMLSKSLSGIIGLKLLLAVLYAFVTIVLAYFIGYSSRQFYILFYLILNQFIASFILYLRSNISGLHLFKTDSILSVLDRFLMIIICGILLWGGITNSPFKIEWFVYSQTLAYSVTLLISILIVIRTSGFFKLNFDRVYFLAILKKSYPFALLSLLMALYYRIDSVMIERMLPDGKEQAGIYAQGFRILDAASMFSFLFAALLLPMFSRMIKNRQPVASLVQFSFLLLIVPAVGLVFASYFYKLQIIDILYHHHVSYAADIFGILIFCFIGISSSYIFGTLLTANGNLKYLNILSAGGALLNIVLNIILIPRYYAWGAAIASLFTQTIIAVIQILIVKKVFHFHISFIKILTLALFILAVWIISRYSVLIQLNWIVKFTAVILLSALFAFLFRLIKLKALYDLLKNGDK